MTQGNELTEQRRELPWVRVEPRAVRHDEYEDATVKP
jgi:predicted dithiol-disulfide oxidoreductase (DUF899 family)